jgi:hypothetical protein
LADTSLIISPVFFSAFNYTLLGQLITRLGPEYSFLRPKLYIAIFVGSDVLSLVLQAIGGGWAASSTEPPQAATDLMIIGIIFQLGTMIVFTTLAMDFWYRTSNGKAYRRGDAESIEMEPKGTYFADRMPRINLLFVGILISSLTIIIRGKFSHDVAESGFYRSVELIQGWDGYLMNHGESGVTPPLIPRVVPGRVRWDHDDHRGCRLERVSPGIHPAEGVDVRAIRE